MTSAVERVGAGEPSAGATAILVVARDVDRRLVSLFGVDDVIMGRAEPSRNLSPPPATTDYPPLTRTGTNRVLFIQAPCSFGMP